MYSAEVKAEVRRIRIEERIGYKAIAARCGIALSTVSLWLRDVVLETEEINKLRYAGCLVRAERCRVDREASVSFLPDNQEFRDGLCLYWAEGSRGKLSFANGDWRMHRIMLRWMERSMASAPIGNVVRVAANFDRLTAESYWQALFPELRIMARSEKASRLRSKCPYGVLAIDYSKGTTGVRIIRHWIEQVYGVEAGQTTFAAVAQQAEHSALNR